MGWAWHCDSVMQVVTTNLVSAAPAAPAASAMMEERAAVQPRVKRSPALQQTDFKCSGQQSELSLSPSLYWKLILAAGIYADQETGCQVFHICQDGGRMDSFFCPNLTLFNQRFFVCDWWADSCCPPCWVWVSGRTMWTVTPPISTSTSTPRSIRHQRRYPTLSSRPLGSLRSVTSQSFILQFQFNHYNIFTNEILLLSWSELCFNQFI